MKTGTPEASPWLSPIDRERRPTLRNRDRLRAAAAMIDAALLSALIWGVFAAVMR